MKFYDKNGKQHKSVIGAMFGTVTTRADEMIKKKLPGFKETDSMDNEEEEDFLYDEDIEEEPQQNEPVIPMVIAEDSHPVETIPDPAAVNIQDATNIEIDYSHQRLILKGQNGEIIADAPIDYRLVKNTIDKDVLDILYPDGNIPAGVESNIQSKGGVFQPVKKDEEPPTEYYPPTTNNVESDGSCG